MDGYCNTSPLVRYLPKVNLVFFYLARVPHCTVGYVKETALPFYVDLQNIVWLNRPRWENMTLAFTKSKHYPLIFFMGL
jgi:hypothetical protein